MQPGVGRRIESEERNQTLRELENIPSLLRTRSGHHNEMTQREEFLKTLPCLNFEKGVSSEDKEEGPAVNPLEVTDRVDRVRFPAPLQFDIGGGKRRIGPYSKPDHIETMGSIRNPLRFLVGRRRRGDKDHLLKVKELPDLLRSPEMSQMDGIKGPAEEAPSFFFGFCSDP